MDSRDDEEGIEKAFKKSVTIEGEGGQQFYYNGGWS